MRCFSVVWLAVVSSCFVVVSRGATVIGNVVDSADQPARYALTFVPLSTPYQDGTNTITDAARSTNINGAFSIWLRGGLYRCEFRPLNPRSPLIQNPASKPVKILVPLDDVGVYQFNYLASLATNLPTLNWTNGTPWAMDGIGGISNSLPIHLAGVMQFGPGLGWVLGHDGSGLFSTVFSTELTNAPSTAFLSFDPSNGQIVATTNLAAVNIRWDTNQVPVNTSTVKAWATATMTNGALFRFPLYQ